MSKDAGAYSETVKNANAGAYTYIKYIGLHAGCMLATTSSTQN